MNKTEKAGKRNSCMKTKSSMGSTSLSSDGKRGRGLAMKIIRVGAWGIPEKKDTDKC
jgi:hypothetical protein